jgi:hypothetical protein
MEAAMRNLLATCLFTLCCTGAIADDLQHLLPASTARGILEQLQPDGHRRFAVVDYARHSSQPRFLLFERDNLRLVGSFRVAHGRGSDPDHDGYADSFSDTEGSHASSLGVFRTSTVYVSDEPGHGLSMRLLGLSESNANAERRAIVLHARDYMEEDFLRRHGVAGRSHGCLVLADTDRDQAVSALRGGALIFAVDTRRSSQSYISQRK